MNDEKLPADTKISSSVSMDQQAPVHEKINYSIPDNQQLPNLWAKLPNEMIEKILIDTVKSSDNVVETYRAVSRTCSKFKEIVQRKQESLLPRLYIKFQDRVLDTLPRWNGMIKVSVRKVVKIFGSLSGVAVSLADMIKDKKWKSAWLTIRPEKHSWFTVERIISKSSGKLTDQTKEISRSNESQVIFWVRNDLYNLHIEDEQILRSPNLWLNDRIMDAAQKRICQELGTDYQSVLNVQKRDIAPYRPVSNEHIQLLHDGSNHWILTLCSNGRVQICDSLKTTTGQSTKKCVDALYKKFVNESGKLIINFLPVQKQPDGFNCGPFAVAFAAEVLNGSSPMDAHFDVGKMRHHLILCLMKKNLLPFP